MVLLFSGLTVNRKGYIAANSVNIEVPKVLDNKENEILGNKKITTKRPDVEGKMIFQIVDLLFGKVR